MTAFTFKVEGFKGIEEALAGLTTVRKRKAQLKRVMKEALEPVARDAQAMAPVLSGRMKASIGVSDKLNRSQRKQVSKNDDEIVMHVGPYGRVNTITEEFGAQGRPPKPFMRPAWDQNSRDMLNALAVGLLPEIEAAVKRQRS
jgi:HK97 gp10 family phage protein